MPVLPTSLLVGFTHEPDGRPTRFDPASSRCTIDGNNRCLRQVFILSTPQPLPRRKQQVLHVLS